MQKLKQSLKAKLSNYKRLAILCIGSDLRADDSFGIIFGTGFQKINARRRRVQVFLGFTAPESITHKIKKFAPSHLLLVDAADMGLKHGEMKLFGEESIKGISFSTHTIPLMVLVDYLKTEIEGLQVAIVGAQPGTLLFDTEPSDEIRRSAQNLVEALSELISMN
jgi:hydrogenase 3 maturation protease